MKLLELEARIQKREEIKTDFNIKISEDTKKIWRNGNVHSH